jgi:hypothetical protein
MTKSAPAVNHPQNHLLKTNTEYFQMVWDGDKTYEVRVHDRPYKVGDTLILRDWNNEKDQWSDRNRTIVARVTHICYLGNIARAVRVQDAGKSIVGMQIRVIEKSDQTGGVEQRWVAI